MYIHLIYIYIVYSSIQHCIDLCIYLFMHVLIHHLCRNVHALCVTGWETGRRTAKPHWAAAQLKF